MTTDTIKLWENEETGSQFTMFSFSQITNATDKFSTESKLGEGGLALCTRYHVLSVSSVHMFDHFKNKNKNADYEACGYVVKFLYVLGTNPSARPYLVIAKIQIIYTDKGY